MLLLAVLLLGIVTLHTLGHPSEQGLAPWSVCLAVLGAFTLVLLLSAALGGSHSTHLSPPRPARLLRAPWPDPPPARPSFSGLSVLRI